MKSIFILFVTIALLLFGQAWAKAATVTTDQSDYPPGSTAIITGTGFAAGEVVQLQVVNLTNPDDTGSEHAPWTVTNDVDGNFTATWYVTEDEANTALQLTATGLTSGVVAQTTFTDSATVTGVSVGTQNGALSYGTAGSATYTITVTGSGSGSLTLVSVSNLPSGTTFSPTSVTNIHPTDTFTLTLTTDTNTPAGTFSFSIRVVGNGGGAATNSGTLTIGQRSVLITNVTVATKIYDGTTSATLSGGAVSNTVNGDNVTFTTGTGTFANKYIGTWAVTASGYALSTSGVSTNYALSAQPVVPNVSITARSVTITNVTAAGKNYDGTTTATLSGGAISNAISGDTVTYTVGSGAFASQYVGSRAVTASGYALSTSGISTNYSLSAQPAVPNASITTRSVVITNVTAAGKNYDGTTAATLSGGAISNAVSGDTVTFTAGNGVFSSANVGTWTVTASSYALTPSGISTNYSLGAQPGVPNASITARALGITANNDTKTYGQTKTYGAGQTTFTSSGLQNGETIGSVTITASGGTATNAAVGTYNLTPSAATGGTFSTGNYSITYTNGTLTVSKAATVVSVSSSLNPSGYKDSVSFTASLPADATGNVIFAAGGSPISTNTLSSGSASSTATISLPRGTNTITAQYAGDGNYIGSTNNLAGGQVVTNHPPVAGSFSYTNGSASFKLTIASLLSNVTDVDGDTILLAGFSTSTNGITIVTNSTLLQYRNNNNVNDRFNYMVNDGFGGSATGTVSVVFSPFPTTGQSNNVVISGGMAHLKYYGIPNYRYGVERSTNLVNWTSILTTNAPANGAFSYDDNFSDLGAPPASAYYRLKWNP